MARTGQRLHRLAIIATSFLAYRATSDTPPTLLRLEESRANLKSGELSWSRELREQPGRECRFVNRYAANGDRIFEERGDQEGWVAWPRGAERPMHRFPTFYMQNGDGIWKYAETSLACDFWSSSEEGLPADEGEFRPQPSEFLDIRWIGLCPTYAGDILDAPSFLHGSRPGSDAPRVPHRNWEERRHGSQVEVTATAADGARLSWHIDPSRGWNATRVTSESADGRTNLACECRLREFDGTWFPAEVRYSHNGEVYARISVHEARFNDAKDAAAFGGRDIKLTAGVNIVPQNFRLENRYAGRRFWNGDAIVDGEEWFADLRAGRRKRGPVLEAKLRGEHSPYMTPEQIKQWEAEHQKLIYGAQTEGVVSAWERYTLEFIRRYRLEPDQAEAAKFVLWDCQEQAQEHLAAHRDEILEAVRGIHAGPGGAAKARARLEALRTPLDRIFERQLKPRLETIPTRQQRREAESQPATP